MRPESTLGLFGSQCDAIKKTLVTVITGVMTCSNSFLYRARRLRVSFCFIILIGSLARHFIDGLAPSSKHYNSTSTLYSGEPGNCIICDHIFLRRYIIKKCILMSDMNGSYYVYVATLHHK